MKTLKFNGKEYVVTASPLKGKQNRVNYGGKNIDFGDPNSRTFPGTKRGDNYCARSSGIKGADNPNSANFWARLDWKCRGKKSQR